MKGNARWDIRAEAAKELRAILEDPEMTRYIGPDASFYLDEIIGMAVAD